MKILAALFLAFLCASALATNTPPLPAPTATASSNQTQGGQVMGGQAMGGQTMNGDTSLYVLPAPIGGSNLPAGMCQTSKYSHRAFVWNFVSLADGDSHTDMECLKMLVQLEPLRTTPTAVTPVVYPTAATVTAPICTPLARKTKLGAGCPR